MNGLIKQSNLEGLNNLASFGVAFFMLASALLAFAGVGGIASELAAPNELPPHDPPQSVRRQSPTEADPQVEAAVRSNPDNQDVVAFAGFDFIGGGFRNNAATLFVTQKPWHERQTTSQQLVGELFMKTAGIREALVLAFNPPAIFGLGTAGGYVFFLQNRGDGGSRRLQEVLQQFLARANSDPQLGGAQTLWRASVPQLFVDVDREKAKKAGVRSTKCLPRCRLRSAPTTSTISTSTDAPGRC